MPLTIKNDQVEQLAREAARLGKTNLTQAVGDALELWMRQHQGKKHAPVLREVLTEISDRCSSLPDLDTRSEDEILGYDDQGMTGHGR